MKSSGKGLTTVLALTLAIVGVIDTGTVLAEGSRDARCGRVFATNGQNQLLRLDVQRTLYGGSYESDANIGIKSRKPITGLTLNDVLVGVDFRPAGFVPPGRSARNQLYGLARLPSTPGTAQLYRIDTDTAVATPVGIRILLFGPSVGFDFNPVSDRIRVVVAETGRSSQFQLNPDLGGPPSSNDSFLVYALGDPNMGRVPQVTGIAYTNPDNEPVAPANTAGNQTNTVLYDIDAGRERDNAGSDVLAIQAPENPGQLNTVGRLGSDTGAIVGFDISLRNEALAALQVGGSSMLASIDLISGRAGNRGRVYEVLTGLAIEVGPECDRAGGGDDDDYDDDGVGDDIDPDDDGDGKGDGADTDDDNDTILDAIDLDDDNDDILDIFDNQSTREIQELYTNNANPGEVAEYSMVADADTGLLTASVLATDADPVNQPLTVEIYNPLGMLVATSLPTPGRATATVMPIGQGSYTVRVRCQGLNAVTYKATLVLSQKWF